MAGKSQHTAAKPNGELQRSFINFDPDDPEYVKDLQRPAAIKEDLSEMERRKRVHEVLESRDFCKELEELIRQDTSLKSDDDNTETMKRLSQLTMPFGQLSSISIHKSVAQVPILPIADLRDNNNYTKLEKIYRNKLASLYRLVDLFQWSQGIYNHITLRVSPDADEVLINPFGLLYHEITASSLLKINLNGDVLDKGSTKLGINNAGFILHSAIHSNRLDVNCVIHLHTPVVAAVSCMKAGLLPICQEALIIGPVGYHDYQGILVDEDEKQSIVDDLGNKNMLILRTNGFLICGETIEEAVYLARNLIAACDHQIRAIRAGIENLVIPDEKAVERAYKTAKQGGGGVNRSPDLAADNKIINWKIGELEWEAWMRVLDNAGYRTGHLYKQLGPRIKSAYSSTKPIHNDVALPPCSSAMGMVYEDDQEAVTAHKMALLRREQDKSRWLNSPNAYQRIEILETGTSHPKRITKWVQDVNQSSQTSTPVKISSPHQFSPFSANPKEFKEKQKAIKETRLLGSTTAGPQSQILDGVTYEDVAQLRTADGPSAFSTQIDRVVMIGTASKGIIERQHQHNAQVYRQLYAPNPFASETDEDIQKYMKEVEAKTPHPGSELETCADSSVIRTHDIHDTDSTYAESVSLIHATRKYRLGDTEATALADDDTNPSIDVSISYKQIKADVDQLTSDTSFDESNLVRQRNLHSTPAASLSPDKSGSYKKDSNMWERESRISTSYANGFKRSKSERLASSFRAKLRFKSNDGATQNSDYTVSEDEINTSKDGKKKKKRFFSFGKKKK